MYYTLGIPKTSSEPAYYLYYEKYIPEPPCLKSETTFTFNLSEAIQFPNLDSAQKMLLLLKSLGEDYPAVNEFYDFDKFEVVNIPGEEEKDERKNP